MFTVVLAASYHSMTNHHPLDIIPRSSGAQPNASTEVTCIGSERLCLIIIHGSKKLEFHLNMLHTWTFADGTE